MIRQIPGAGYGERCARRWVIGVVCSAAAFWPAAAYAQAAPLPGRFEVAAGGLWAGGVSAGAAEATETAPDGTRFRLFASRTSIGPGTGLEGRIGVRLTRVFQVEGSVSYSEPELRTRISSDVEGIPDVTVAETVNQWTIDAAILAHLVGWRLGTRGFPFASAGAGYLRQIHERATLAESGLTYQVGGGINYLLKRTGGGRLKSAGLRVDARATFRTGAIRIDDRVRVGPLVGASVFFRF